MGRLIDADRLKAHYCWWSGGTKEMTIDEAKKTFDTIIDVQPTVDIDAITGTHERIGFDKGYKEGYAQATSEERHGHWNENNDGTLWCSVCISEAPCEEDYWGYVLNAPHYDYCPNCGAKMDEVKE